MRVFALLGLSVGLFGCGGANVLVDTTVPTPLVEPIPINVGVHYGKTLTDYVHEEDLDAFGKFRIELGATQVPVFERVFAAMFTNVIRVGSVEARGAAVDFVIAPMVEDLQFSIPAQTRSDFFEVWIKYNIKIYDTGGELVANWQFPAYGKSNSRNFGFMEGSKEPGLNEATVWALRDAAAHFAFYFRDIPEIKAWLAAGRVGAQR